LREDSLTWFHAAEFDHRAPSSQPSAGKGSCFDLGEVIRSSDQRLRRKNPVLSEDAVESAAERPTHFRRRRFAADPGFEEAADDAIARHELPHVRTGRLNDSRAVWDGYQWKLLPRAVPALDGEKVAIVQRRGLDAHQHLA
jgi:hypothetical protein